MARVAFSAEISDMRGKIGNTVFTRARSGATARGRVPVRNPNTPEQAAVRSYLAKASGAYKNMTPSQVLAWDLYAETQTAHNDLTGDSYAPSANQCFVKLAAKFLQATPTGTIPLTPPAASFTGDAIIVTATNAGGEINFTASGPNSAGVKVELLVQPLPSQNRAPSPTGYRSKQFVAFASGSLTVSVPLPVGYYAPAYRFVDTATGQDTGLITLPVLQVY